MRFGRRALLTTIGVTILLLLIGGRALAGIMTELLWYDSIGMEQVFWTQWRAALLVRGVVALIIAALVFANLWVVTGSLGAIRVRRRYANIEIAERLPQSWVVGAVSLVSLFSAWWLSTAVADPLPALAALRPVTWGLTDPVFGYDAAFYVFQLPLLNRLQTLAALLVFWIALLAIAAYVATGAVKVAENRPTLSRLARRHLGILLAAFLALYAVSVWLGRYELVVAGNGFGGAIGYTDVSARLPAKLIIALLALLAAGAVAHAAWVGRFRFAIAAGILLFLGIVGGEVIYPSSVQRFVVEPNQFPRERPFIEYNLDFTRRAYGLDEIERVQLPYQSRPEVEEADLLERLAGVPLWDPRPLLTTYRQQQGLFRYYTFNSVHHDRYPGADGAEPLAISVRELETNDLEEAAQTWQNLHLNYVAGQGAVVSPVSRMMPDGTTPYYVWDLDPPKLAPDAPRSLMLERPEVYFGERTREYIIIDQAADPLGISLGTTARKLLFAWAFQSKNILLVDTPHEESEIVFRRRVPDRVQAVAPFLRISPDRSSYPVIADGRLVWVVDAFTTSASFPLAPLVGFENRGVRYVRNSVKATVDALTGEVTLYEVDPGDPILATYSRIFPGLVRPMEEMPEGLQEHLRYPVTLMNLQAQVLGAYHLMDPAAFYAQQDVWSLAAEQYQGARIPMEPKYSMYPLPGSESSEFLLTVPFVARGRQNMTALFATRNDPPHYGEQVLYLLPRDELVPGPEQIEAMIDQDPEISQQLALWRRGGSDVIRGHLMIVPIGGSLVYVEPLFLEAEQAAIPQLERVLVARAGQVVMQPTFELAVAALLGTDGARRTLASGEETGGEPSAVVDADALARARRLLTEAETLLRAGDWAGFGRSLNSLREALESAQLQP